MKNYFKILMKIALAGPLIIFGLNKFLGFASVPPPEGKTAQMFLTAMFTSYLFKLVGISEILGGLLYLINRTSFLGYLILGPVVLNIALFHLSHDLPGNGIWIFTLLVYLYATYEKRAQILQLLKIE